MTVRGGSSRSLALARRGTSHPLLGARVLVVDDDASLRELTIRVLRAMGGTVSEAERGPEAMRLVEQAPLPFDLLVTDFSMPTMSGLELAAQVRARTPQVAVLILSGYAEDSPVGRDLRSAACAYLTKPFRLRAFEECITALMQQRALPV